MEQEAHVRFFLGRELSSGLKHRLLGLQSAWSGLELTDEPFSPTRTCRGSPEWSPLLAAIASS